MKKDFDDYELLTLRWHSLTQDALCKKKFDSDDFIELFKKTFEVLKKYSVQSSLDRDIMDLVFTISGFVASRFIEISYEHAAATEISEAMIHCCLYEEPHKEIISGGNWYIFSDIYLDFTNPEEMLFDLALDFEKWDSIPQG